MEKLTLDLLDDRIVVLFGDDEIADLAELRRRATDVPAADIARAVAVLGPQGYEVITDPAAFQAAYLARLETEDPAAPWRPDVVRLRDFGIPDFAGITAPAREGDTLVFFARDTFTGLAYRMDLVLEDGAVPVYRPLGLLPLPAAPSPAPPVVPAAPVIGPQAPPDDMEPADPEDLGEDDDEDDDDDDDL